MLVSQLGRDYCNILFVEISISLKSISKHWVDGMKIIPNASYFKIQL